MEGEPKSLTAQDVRHLAAHQNSVFTPPMKVPKFSEFPDINAFMILTCMDPRCNPHQFWNLGAAPIPVFRNAGGRAADFLRSAEALDTIMSNGRTKVGTIAVIQHTDCGLVNFDSDYIKNKIRSRFPNLTKEQLAELEAKDYLDLKHVKIEESIRQDMDLIKNDPYLTKDIEVLGFVYDSFTGKTTEVV